MIMIIINLLVLAMFLHVFIIFCFIVTGEIIDLYGKICYVLGKY